MKNIIQSLHNVKQSSTKIASFSILNLDSEFPLDAVSLTVPYGINSVTVSLENYLEAEFLIATDDIISEEISNDIFKKLKATGMWYYIIE